MGLFARLFGDSNRRILALHGPTVRRINELEPLFEKLSEEDLAGKTSTFRDRLSQGESLDELLPEAFAAVREASKRTLGQRHFDVQLLGGIVLHNNSIAEMRTGEGKTLVATLPAYLNALSGKGVHIVTVNDYLSRRDAVWMGQIYHALGMSVGVINHDTSYRYDPAHLIEEGREGDVDEKRDALGAFKIQYEFLRPSTRKEAYDADITYGTNNEFGFDYLRDNIAYKRSDLRQRVPEEGGFHYAIIDEVDSILIDEARTPLIISAPAAESEGLYRTFSAVARQLSSGDDYEVDEKLKAITLTDRGIEKAEKILGIENIYTEKGIKYVHHLETAVKAKALFEKDRNYVIRDGEIVIVDEFTGRLQPGRRWSEGLHQAIEAKEGVPIQKESRTFASVTFQNYFRMYDKLAGMTGTAATSSEEFYSVYKLETVVVPTNRVTKRVDHDDFIFQTEKGKFQAVAREVKARHERGQPVLVGTVSIEKNELLSAYLRKEGVPHELLNAKNHEQEGEIIAQAGRKGAVTIATNLAGRGVDIKLGGALATEEEHEEVKSLGGLFVLGTERHEARRIDNQLRGRTGRQGDPGETQFFVSLEDTLMRVFASDSVKRMMGRFGIPEDEPIRNSMITKALESAQTKIEGFNFDARKHVLEFDNVLNSQRHAIYERRDRVLLGNNDELALEVDALVADDEGLAATLKERRAQMGDEAFYAAIRQLMLQSIDVLWVEHLEGMDYLRGSVNLRAYGQRDPLIEYRKEGQRYFRELLENIDEQMRRLLPAVGAGSFGAARENLREIHEGAQSIGRTNTGDKVANDTRGKARHGKVGRNELVEVTNGTETKVMKFKRAEELLKKGWTLTLKKKETA